MVAGFLVLGWCFVFWIYIMIRVSKGTVKAVKVVREQPQPVPFLAGYVVFLVVVFAFLALVVAR